MSRITIDIDTGQVEKIVESLTMEEKLRLVYKLEKETLRQRWNDLLNIIDERLKKHPMSRQEISKEIDHARNEHYAKCRN